MLIDFQMPLEYSHDGTTSEILITGKAAVTFGRQWYDEDLREYFDEEDEAEILSLYLDGAMVLDMFISDELRKMAEKKAKKTACAKLDADTMHEFIAQFQAQPTQ